MGTDMCAAWVELDRGPTLWSGRSRWSCLATFEEIFRRDYLLYDILGGARHGMQRYSLTVERNLDSWSEETYQHSHVFVSDPEAHRKHLLDFFSEPSWIPDDQWHFEKNTWYPKHVAEPMESCFGLSAVRLPDLIEAQRRYVEELQRDWDTTVDLRAEDEKLHDEWEANGSQGSFMWRASGVVPHEHSGLKLVIGFMTTVTELYPNRDLRMTFCFNN